MESKKVSTKQTNELMKKAVENISNDIWRDFMVSGSEVVGKIPVKYRKDYAIVKITVSRDSDDLEDYDVEGLSVLFNDEETEISDKQLEDLTHKNLELIGGFAEFYKNETGNQITENVIESFFNA